MFRSQKYFIISNFDLLHTPPYLVQFLFYYTQFWVGLSDFYGLQNPRYNGSVL